MCPSVTMPFTDPDPMRNHVQKVQMPMLMFHCVAVFVNVTCGNSRYVLKTCFIICTLDAFCVRVATSTFGTPPLSTGGNSRAGRKDLVLFGFFYRQRTTYLWLNVGGN